MALFFTFWAGTCVGFLFGAWWLGAHRKPPLPELENSVYMKPGAYTIVASTTGISIHPIDPTKRPYAHRGQKGHIFTT